MSENKGTTQSNTPSVTLREFDISIWQDILHIVEHLYDELIESGCLEKEDTEYYKALREALLSIYREYFLKGNEEQEKVYKVVVIEALKILINRLLFCV
jgi:hypothetical protein